MDLIESIRRSHGFNGTHPDVQSKELRGNLGGALNMYLSFFLFAMNSRADFVDW